MQKLMPVSQFSRNSPLKGGFKWLEPTAESPRIGCRPPKCSQSLLQFSLVTAVGLGWRSRRESHEDCSGQELLREFAVSGTLSGKVVEVDDSGNLITDIPAATLDGKPQDASLRIVVDEHETYGVYPVDHTQPAMTLVAILNGDDPLKIVLVGDSVMAG